MFNRFNSSRIPAERPHSPNFDKIPAELTALPQWLCWRLETRDGKPAKVPKCARTGGNASSKNSATWCDFDTAVAAYQQGGFDGIGFVFTKESGIVGIDLDECIDADTGELTAWAQEIVADLDSYTEISPSGKGLHSYVGGTIHQSARKGSHATSAVEIYDEGRYFTVSGQRFSERRKVEDRQEALTRVYNRIFGDGATRKPATSPATADLSLSDTELLNKAMAASNGAKFRDLWNGDTSAHAGDDSAADLALCGLLAFWTQKDAGRIDRLFRKSGLMRPKWERTNYRQRTIDKAIAECQEVYTGSGKARGNGQDHDPPNFERLPVEAYDESQTADSVEDSRPEIRVQGGELPAMTDAAERALLADTARQAIYQRDIQLVRTARAASDSVTGHIRRQAGALRIIPVDQPYLLERFTQTAKWVKWNDREKKLKPTDAPRAVADIYLSRIGRWNCPALTGIIEAPTLRPDGSILDKPGYDPETGLIFDPGATHFEPIPVNPSLEDARRAIQILREVIKGFPFVAEHDEAVALVAILTALVRKGLRSAPLFGFSAPVMGSGKSLLADVVALILTGGRAPAWTYTGDPDEERKHITSALLAGDPIACIDNISAPLDGDRLCSVLTQETIEDRLLGVMKKVNVSTACLWMATGNNLEIRGDLSTRALVCRLDAATENPEEREFQVDLFEWIPANRAKLVTAALTILRAYHVAGRPKQPIKQFGRFETWSDWVRAALVWTGVDDPCKARIQVAAADPAWQQLTALLSAWYATFKEQSVTAADVIKAARVTVTAGEETYATPEGEALRSALLAVAGHGDVINPRVFGRYLAKNQGRIIDGHRLDPAGVYGHAQKWRVCRGNFGVSGVSGVSHPPRTEFGSEKNCEPVETAKIVEGTSRNSNNSTNSKNPPEPPAADDGFEDFDAAMEGSFDAHN